MTDTPFIVTGWVGTAATVAAYAIAVLRRTRRAQAAARVRQGPGR